MTEWYEAENPSGGKLPECSECGETIYGEYRWNIGGKIYCEDCADDLFREANDPEYDEGRYEDERT